MEIKRTVMISPIITHPNGDTSISCEIRSEIVMNTKTPPLKKLVGFACYNGNGYSKDDDDIKKR
jgi:hypothetical protein